MVEHIRNDLEKSYGIMPHSIETVVGGYLNRKWKISTDRGTFLVKQYSAKRFDERDIEVIESRLQRQILLREMGVCCPSLLQCGGRVIRRLDDETAYMVMEFCEGSTESAEAATIAQMRNLGEACAVMHSAFSQLREPLPGDLPTFGGYTLDALWENYNRRAKECTIVMADAMNTADMEYRKALFAMEPILKQIEVGFFDRCNKGLAHEDFQAGNILFSGEEVSAIVDFDRNCYSFPLHDVGRALMSFALEGGALNTEKARAFAEGYARRLPLTAADIANALRLTWCIETPWWIQPGFFGECDAIPRRFREEMLWLTEHWFALDAILVD